MTLSYKYFPDYYLEIVLAVHPLIWIFVNFNMIDYGKELVEFINLHYDKSTVFGKLHRCLRLIFRPLILSDR